MKITKHISFYYNSNRICYINRIIQECNSYPFITDIFIHTNYKFSNEILHENTNGKIEIIVHDLSNINPFYLTWKCRDLLKNQKDDYDIFMYIEDDILVPKEAILYWLKYNEQLIARNYNLGFVRIETLHDEEYITDLQKNEYLTKYLLFPRIGKADSEETNVENVPNRKAVLNVLLQSLCSTNSEGDLLSPDELDDLFVINDKNPYCAFWIYNKHEFHKYVNSELYNIQNIKGYLFREASAIGLHGLETNWYKHTIIPLHLCRFTPLKIYNGTPKGRPTRDSRATLPINELKGNPPMADCPISNLHRCKSPPEGGDSSDKVTLPRALKMREGVTPEYTENDNAMNTLHPSCKIYHLPNNYVTDPNNTFATIKFNECVKIT